MNIQKPTAELTTAQRAAIDDVIAESRLERLATELWLQASDAGDFAEASRIAAETQAWFEAEGDRWP